MLHFAYPNGQPQDISTSILQHVRDAGFETAVALPPVSLAYDNPYLLKRIGVLPIMPEYQFRQQVASFRVA